MQHYADCLARALKEICDCAFHTISPDDGVSGKRCAGRLVDRLYLLNRLRRFYDPSRGRRIAEEIISKYLPNVVHITCGVPSMSTMVGTFQRKGIKVVYTIHDPMPHQEHRTLWGKVNSRYLRRRNLQHVLNAVDLVHLHSHSLFSAFDRAQLDLESKRVYFVQHGSGLPSTIEAGSGVPRELETAGIRGFALFFGRIEPYKGLKYLLEALEEVRNVDPEFQLVIAGSGRTPEIPQDLSSQILVINRFIPDGEVRALLQSASFVILPYVEGTQTGVIPLAAACGIPSVVTRVGALPELVEDGQTGIVVEPCDKGALATAILRMMENPLRTRQMGEAARRLMQSRYSWAAVAQEHLRHYESLVSGAFDEMD